MSVTLPPESVQQRRNRHRRHFFGSALLPPDEVNRHGLGWKQKETPTGNFSLARMGKKMCTRMRRGSLFSEDGVGNHLGIDLNPDEKGRVVKSSILAKTKAKNR